MITFKQLWDDYRKHSSQKECFHHDKTRCSNKIKRAHSIQKENVLSQLEAPLNGNNLIYSFGSFTHEGSGTRSLVPIGKNKASIFSGFCDYHDSKLFSPLENFHFKFSDEQLFLMTYRAFAHGFHQLLEMYNYYGSDGIVPSMVPKKIIDLHRQYYKKCISKFLVYKRILDNSIQHQDYASIKYHIRIIEPFVPIACASVLSPVYTYKNIFLSPREEHSYVVLNVLPDKQRTIILLSHFEPDYKGEILFNELKDLSDNEFTHAISSLMIYCTTNTFFSPQLWEKFSDQDRKQLFLEFDFAVDKGSEIKEFFRSKFDFFRMST